MLVKVFLKLLKFCVEGPVGVAGSRRRGVVVAQQRDLSHDLPGFLMLTFHHFNGIVHSSKMSLRQCPGFSLGLHHFLDKREQDQFFFLAVGAHFPGNFIEKVVDLEQLVVMVTMHLLYPGTVSFNQRDAFVYISVVDVDNVICQKIQFPAVIIVGTGGSIFTVDKFRGQVLQVGVRFLGSFLNAYPSATAEVDPVFFKDMCRPDVLGNQVSDCFCF